MRASHDETIRSRLQHRGEALVPPPVPTRIEDAVWRTFFVVTADHGELFGEDGFFGHGPVMHPKCFEVPFLEGNHPIHRELSAPLAT